MGMVPKIFPPFPEREDVDLYATLIPAKEVETIDTTGAGDVFCGAFSAYLSENHTLTESVEFANAAAALAVTRMGAQSAIPYKREITL